MKVCLIRPSTLVDINGFLVESTPPIGLAYIAGALRNVGHKVSVIDAFGEAPRNYDMLDCKLNISKKIVDNSLHTNGLGFQDILDRIPAHVDVIGISCMFSNNWLSDRNLIKIIKENFPSKIIFAGGESITAKPELWMSQSPIDYCILGEGEEIVVELTNALEANLPVGKVNGIAYREGQKIYKTPPKSRIRELDEIPLPAWDLFPIENYIKYDLQFTGSSKMTLPIVATRGCPYSCTFCSNPVMWGKRYYMRDPRCVVDEIEGLIKTYNVSEIDFYDLTAIIKKDWIISFAKELMGRSLDVKWNLPSGTRSEAIDEEVAHYLRISGCRSINYAPESGSPRMLKLIKKKVSLDDMLISMRASSKNGLRVSINTILALPGEEHRDVWQTIIFAMKCSWVGVYEIGLTMFHPYPGSELFEVLLKNGKINLDNDDFFYDTISSSPLKKVDYHDTDKVASYWYPIYKLILYIAFYGTNYLFRPIRFFRFMKNVLSRKHESRFERTISKIIYKEGLHNEAKKKLENAEMIVNANLFN
jgi:anaerobic magnesium-protoporphyrin IX monomethyl ester cyclase